MENRLLRGASQQHIEEIEQTFEKVVCLET